MTDLKNELNQLSGAVNSEVTSLEPINEVWMLTPKKGNSDGVEHMYMVLNDKAFIMGPAEWDNFALEVATTALVMHGVPREEAKELTSAIAMLEPKGNLQ
jgi:hypothetical protein